MSTATATLSPALTTAQRDTRPSLMRLTTVELRKMTDTRAGFWLQLAVVALTAVVTAVYCIVAPDADQTFVQILEAALAPATILLPVVGILLVSSEWSQRTAMITFGLVPDRSRVFAAKLVASVALSLPVLVSCIAVAALGTAFAPSGVDGAWSLSAGMLGQVAISIATGMITGVAFGAALLASAPAIVLYFGLPTALGALGSIPGLEGTAEWLDGTRSLAPLNEHLMSATEWAHAGTTLAAWTLLPLLVGLWRIRHSDVR
jgi:ABC-2 type transport system permease protein